MPRGLRVVLAVVAAAVVAAPLAGCGSAGRASPLTGLPVTSDRPVLAVKVDNSPAGRPWTGVEDADVVYVEPVEGGTTRLLAVFSSRLPASVGPVRSARESDVTVLAAYGHPALAFSGSAPELAPTLAGAPIAAVTPETAAPAFHRDPARRAPSNLYADPAALLSAAGSAGGASPPRDVGFRFGALPPGGDVVRRRDVAFGTAELVLTWDAVRGRWIVEPGAAGPVVPATGGDPVGAATVLVQHVTTRPSAIRDAAGAVSPYAVTVGEGAAEVLRDGRSFPARWSRPTPTDPTAVLGADRLPVPFAAGPVWVLLVPDG
ncbi:hypothetical protein Acsp06_28300 [Actinomycetospora sp. NBRC 106375]|uniref:DUF3048 domain-containing protein n=1 Tax=Actinomycetospora sp. NBRC 106375 TaxID=3032207 RepID=UPI0024A3D54F|nr:DUF3048 domain-containing protein [Actinomycetospora sp. NBRC 106375]GLZ46645.1 hypothetical protein Acsp06_28300 [Actinomycetospora sp. NBRC 106375]